MVTLAAWSLIFHSSQLVIHPPALALLLPGASHKTPLPILLPPNISILPTTLPHFSTSTQQSVLNNERTRTPDPITILQIFKTTSMCPI